VPGTRDPGRGTQDAGPGDAGGRDGRDRVFVVGRTSLPVDDERDGDADE